MAVFGTVGEIERLRAENDRLRGLAAGMQERVTELTEAARENAQLRQLLGLRASLAMQLLPVRVLSVDPSNFSWEVGIDAGTDDGVAVGMAVVGSADGAGALAGTVVSGNARHRTGAIRHRHALERHRARPGDPRPRVSSRAGSVATSSWSTSG